MCKDYPDGCGQTCGFSGFGESWYRPGVAAERQNAPCMLLDSLKSYAMQYGKTMVAYGCGQVWVLPYPVNGGWIIMTSSDGSGVVDSAIYLEEDRGYLLSLAVAEGAIEYYRSQSCARNCGVF